MRSFYPLKRSNDCSWHAAKILRQEKRQVPGAPPHANLCEKCYLWPLAWGLHRVSMTSVWPLFGAFLGRFGEASGMRRSPRTAHSVHRPAVQVVRPSAAHARRQDCPGRGRSMKNRRQLPPFLIRLLRHLYRVCLARSSNRAGCLCSTSTILREKRRQLAAVFIDRTSAGPAIAAGTGSQPVRGRRLEILARPNFANRPENAS